jgi:hypothetical protein
MTSTSTEEDAGLKTPQTGSTHRVIQLSTLIERLHAAAAQNDRAAQAASEIRNRTMAIRFASRDMRCRSIAKYILSSRLPSSPTIARRSRAQGLAH